LPKIHQNKTKPEEFVKKHNEEKKKMLEKIKSAPDLKNLSTPIPVLYDTFDKYLR